MHRSILRLWAREYGIVADIEHKNCMLDLVARAGRFDEAFAMLERDLFVKPNSVTFKMPC